MTDSPSSPAGAGSFYARFAAAFLLFAVLLLVICSALFMVSRENVLSIGHLNAVQMAQNLEYYLIEEIDEIGLAAQTVDVLQSMGRTNEDILEYLTFESRIVNETIDENYTGLYGYINGEYMDGSGWAPPEGYDPTDRPWYQGAVAGKGKVVYITPYVDAETGTIMVSICKLLPDRRSVVSLDVSLDRIQSIVDSGDYAQYDQILVTDKENIVVASSDPLLIDADISSSSMMAARRAASGKADADTYFEYRDTDGESYTVFTAEVEEQWNVYLARKSRSLMSSLYSIYAILAAVTAAFIIFVWLILDSLNRRRKTAENLNAQLESIADIYVSVHRLDLEQNRLEEVRCLPYVREQRRTAEKAAANAHAVLTGIMRALVREEYWPDMQAFLDLDTLDVRMGGARSISMEFLGIHGWSKARIIILERKNDRIKSFLWMLENIDEEKRKQSELRYLSETDLMTGIRNRGCGERLIRELLAGGSGGMFCLMDADDFKSINDTFGHAVGDAVIRIIADRLQSTFAANDIVLRLGGDEFAVFAPGITGARQADGVLDRFIHAIEQTDLPVLSGKRKLSMSIGVSFAAAGPAADFEVLYREADRAAYESKKQCGSCVTYYRTGSGASPCASQKEETE